MPVPVIAWWLGGAAVVGLVYAFSGGSSEEKDEGKEDEVEEDVVDVDVDVEPSGLPDIDCSGVPGGLPGPTGLDTGFDALPDVPIPDLENLSWKDIMLKPMNLTKDQVTWVTQEGSAMYAEELGKQAYCAGYDDVAIALYDKADEIRSWAIESNW